MMWHSGFTVKTYKVVSVASCQLHVRSLRPNPTVQQDVLCPLIYNTQTLNMENGSVSCDFSDDHMVSVSSHICRHLTIGVCMGDVFIVRFLKHTYESPLTPHICLVIWTRCYTKRVTAFSKAYKDAEHIHSVLCCITVTCDAVPL